MQVTEYLKGFPGADALTLVGPFASEYPTSEPVIFVDRGTRVRRDQSGFSVGDGDSSDQAMDHKLSPNKDVSDLAFVLRNLPQHFTRLNLVGFLGGRRDHELINLGESHRFLKERTNPTQIFFDQAVRAFSKGTWIFEAQGLFSLVVFETTQVRLRGDCKFQIDLKKSLDPLSSLGLSNMGHGKVNLDCDHPAFVLFSESD